MTALFSSGRIMISMLPVSVEALEMSWAEAAKALTCRAWDLKPDDCWAPSV